MMNLACKRKEIEDLQKAYDIQKDENCQKKSNPVFQRAQPTDQVPKSTPQKRKPKPVLESKKKKKLTQKNLLTFFKKTPKNN